MQSMMLMFKWRRSVRFISEMLFCYIREDVGDSLCINVFFGALPFDEDVFVVQSPLFKCGMQDWSEINITGVESYQQKSLVITLTEGGKTNSILPTTACSDDKHRKNMKKGTKTRKILAQIPSYLNWRLLVFFQAFMQSADFVRFVSCPGIRKQTDSNVHKNTV